MQLTRPGGGVRAIVAERRDAAAMLAAAGVLLAVLASRLLTARNVDVSGLLTWAERLADGAQPYVDFIEINPPGAFLLYLPAVMLSRLIGVTPEVAVDGMVLALIGVALGLSMRIARRTPLADGLNAVMLTAMATVVLAILPARTFGEREHIGVVALLPMLVAAAVLAHGLKPRLSLQLAAGTLAGLALIAKPHLALPLAGALAVVAVSQRQWRYVLQPMWFVAGGVSLAYLAYAYWAYPAFFTDAMPLVVDVYLPMRLSLVELMSRPPLLVLALLVIPIAGPALRGPMAAILLVAAAAGAAAYVVQGKGWAYHSFPAIAFACLAVAWRLAQCEVSQLSVRATGDAGVQRLLRSAALVLGVALSWAWFDTERAIDRGAIEAILAKAPKHPSMIGITADVVIGHTTVRDVGGRWVQSVGSLWAVKGAMVQLAEPGLTDERRARLKAHYHSQVALLARDLEREKPDVILFEVDALRPGTNDGEAFDCLHWARQQPRIAPLLADYEIIGQARDVLVMARRTP